MQTKEDVSFAIGDRLTVDVANGNSMVAGQYYTADQETCVVLQVVAVERDVAEREADVTFLSQPTCASVMDYSITLAAKTALTRISAPPIFNPTVTYAIPTRYYPQYYPVRRPPSYRPYRPYLPLRGKGGGGKGGGGKGKRFIQLLRDSFQQ